MLLVYFLAVVFLINAFVARLRGRVVEKKPRGCEVSLKAHQRVFRIDYSRVHGNVLDEAEQEQGKSGILF